MQEGFLLNSSVLWELDTTPETTATYERLGAGIMSPDPQNNEDVDQTAYLDGDGFKTSDVTGAQFTVAFSGHRVLGDAAQDFIFDKQSKLGSSRRTNCRMTNANGNQKTGPVTIANINGPGGDASAKGDISFEIHFNGKPTETAATQAPTLSATIAAGTGAGTTKFTATPDSGDTLAYKLYAADPSLPKGNELLDGLTAYTSGNDIAASEGQYILMVELNAYGRVAKAASDILEAADIAS